MDSVKLWISKMIKKLGLDYDEVHAENRNEMYLESAPLPACDVTGCYGEKYCVKSMVYAYCKKHFNMYNSGIDVCGVCLHPSCDVDIISSPKEFCIKHGIIPEESKIDRRRIKLGQSLYTRGDNHVSEAPIQSDT